MSDNSHQQFTPYDFRRAGDLPAQVEGYLCAWLDSHCTVLPEKLADLLSFPLTWRVAAMDWIRPREALERLPQSAIGVALDADLSFVSMLILPRPLAMLLVVGMLGDEGEQLPEDRELTDLEIEITESTLKVFADTLEQSQTILEPMEFRIGSADAKPRRTRMFSSDGHVGVISFEVTGPFGSEVIQWLIGEKLIDSLADRVAAQRQTDDEVRDHLANLVHRMPVEMVIRLGRAELPMSDLAKLEPGDVLVLNQRISEPLEAEIDGVAKYAGWPGRLGVRQAFQVQEMLEKPVSSDFPSSRQP